MVIIAKTILQMSRSSCSGALIVNKLKQTYETCARNASITQRIISLNEV